MSIYHVPRRLDEINFYAFLFSQMFSSEDTCQIFRSKSRFCR
jgi:hypothetical protein